jgi:diguanylate cyclase (GGDEF)-like protein
MLVVSTSRIVDRYVLAQFSNNAKLDAPSAGEAVRRPKNSDGSGHGARPDLSVGADVIVAARMAAVVFLALFIVWAQLPHRGFVSLILGVAATSHVGWWAFFVRGNRPITMGIARMTLLSDTVAIGVVMILTGGADSPAVLIWGPNVAVAAIWLGVRASLPVIGTAIAFLVTVGITDPGITLHLSELEYAVFAAFMLSLIVAHGGVVAARQRSALGVLAAAEEEARQDALTGLSNRRAFEEELPREIDRAQRYGHRLSLLMIDLDDFKAVNDTKGHQTGDAVLIAVAQQLFREQRRSDMVVRLGGEEFVMVLPETDPAAAVSIAERVRKRILESPECEGTTISIGVASFPTSAKTERALIRAADHALYAAKHRGKNQTVMFAGLDARATSSDGSHNL